MKKSSKEKEETEVQLSPKKKAETVPAPDDNDKSETVVPAWSELISGLKTQAGIIFVEANFYGMANRSHSQ